MENSSHTFKSVWATLDRVGERLDKVGEKLDKVAESQAETDRIVKANAIQINGISKNNGAAAEEYFYNALLHGNKKCSANILMMCSEAKSGKRSKAMKTNTCTVYEVRGMTSCCSTVVPFVSLR